MGKKKNVAVFSNYDASEKTLSALHFVKYLLDHRYCHVTWIVTDEIQPRDKQFGFSFYWDKKVLPLHHVDEIKEKTTECVCCFFFEESKLLYSFLPKGTKKALFLDPYTWKHRVSRIFAEKCDFIIAVSPYIVQKIVMPNVFTHDLLCPFNHGLNFASNVQAVPYGGTCESSLLLYNTYGMSFVERQCVLRVSDIVKACCPAWSM